MDVFINFFANMTSLQKFSWILFSITLTWLLEFLWPRMNYSINKIKHASVNLAFLCTSIILNFLILALTARVYIWIEDHKIGLLNQFNLPWYLVLLISVLVLDLVAQWFAHFVLHRYKYLWKFHVIHHSDAYLDATSGTRHHPGDYFIREIFTLLVVLALGVPLYVSIFYRMLTVLFTYLTHGNFSMPLSIDKALSYVFVTPNVHKFHHHFERPWTDSNYGNVFTFWDRLFGTFVYENPEDIIFGVDVVDAEKTNDLKYQMLLPFDKNLKTDY
ncbi:MAG: sterol desaturase family protein [Chitinophagales bacterium]|nr:sterol desaturase family protein [Chitinophagales bacterium]